MRCCSREDESAPPSRSSHRPKLELRPQWQPHPAGRHTVKPRESTRSPQVPRESHEIRTFDPTAASAARVMLMLAPADEETSKAGKQTGKGRPPARPTIIKMGNCLFNLFANTGRRVSLRLRRHGTYQALDHRCVRGPGRHDWHDVPRATLRLTDTRLPIKLKTEGHARRNPH